MEVAFLPMIIEKRCLAFIDEELNTLKSNYTCERCHLRAIKLVPGVSPE